MPSQIEKFRVISDTREKHPWSFPASKYCLGTVTKKIDHGDYSIEGMEDLLFIERKACAAEVAKNIIEKRFDNLIQGTSSYKYKYIICEFGLEDILNYPYSSGLPKSVVKKARVRGAFIMSKMFEYENNNNIHIIYCGDKSTARDYTFSLLKRIHYIENK